MNEPSPELAKRILQGIRRIERRRLVIKTVGFGAVLAVSSVLVVYGCFDVAAEAARSGFTSFVSLFFSDFSVTAASFSDFAFSILESFPVIPVVLLLSGVFCAIWSAAGFVSEISLMREETFSSAT